VMWWDVWLLAVLGALALAAARPPRVPDAALRRLRRFAAADASHERRRPTPIDRFARLTGGTTAAWLRRASSEGRRRRTADRLARAALEWEPETFEALALATGAAAALAAWTLVRLLGLPGPPLGWSACALVIGWLQPRGWMERRGASRRRQFERDLPDALDGIVVGLRAGLSLPAAVAEYAGTAPGVAGQAFRGYLADLAFGRTLEEGMAELLRRYPVEALSVAASTLGQSARLGSPLADALQAQASHLRRMALRRAEEAARALAVKLVLPLVVCVFPQVFIIGLGPVALKLLGPGGLLR